tara:strand:+ start:2057 stop:2422 length:366 start_codon:yes stop_codon:yes gene_type:complete
MSYKSDKSDTLKKKTLETLELSFGVVTTACKNVGIARSTFYEWLKDEEFKNQVNDIQNIALDMAESQLHKQILNGNTTATIFYLKTKGKNRGYVERQEITGAEGMPTNFQIEIIGRTKDKN